MSRRPLPPLNALRAFEAAARLQSVSQAAVELHVTHGAISRHVRTLEEDLGRPLFVREGRGLALTADGMRLRDAASDAFTQLQHIQPACAGVVVIDGVPTISLVEQIGVATGPAIKGVIAQATA